MEDTNPGGSGLALEFGFGARADKFLMLVEVKGFPQERYFGMVRALANEKSKVDSLDEAITEAARLVNQFIAARRSAAIGQ